MARENDEDYDWDLRNKTLMEREERKLERAREKADSLKRNAEKGLAAALKASKQELKKTIVNTVSRSESGVLSPVERQMIDAGIRGDGQIFVNEGIVTGNSEMNKFWLRDDDDGDE